MLNGGHVLCCWEVTGNFLRTPHVFPVLLTSEIPYVQPFLSPHTVRLLGINRKHLAALAPGSGHQANGVITNNNLKLLAYPFSLDHFSENSLKKQMNKLLSNVIPLGSQQVLR